MCPVNCFGSTIRPPDAYLQAWSSISANENRRGQTIVTVVWTGATDTSDSRKERCSAELSELRRLLLIRPMVCSGSSCKDSGKLSLWLAFRDETDRHWYEYRELIHASMTGLTAEESVDSPLLTA